MSKYMNGNKTATVYKRGKNSYRVFLLDSYTENQEEIFFDSERTADDYAEEWVLKNE